MNKSAHRRRVKNLLKSYAAGYRAWYRTQHRAAIEQRRQPELQLDKVHPGWGDPAVRALHGL